MEEYPKRLSFREIADVIRAEIKDGVYPPASVLPPEPQLGERFGASRSLVNRAMQLLAAEGLVRPQQGRGTVVTWIPPMVHSARRYLRAAREEGGARGAFDAEVREIMMQPQHEITTGHAEPPAAVADALGLPSGQVNCLVRRRRLLASGIPARVNESWFPLEIAQGTVLEEAGPVIVGGVKSALAGLGYQEIKGTERILVRRPTPQEVRALEISPERDVLEIFHVARTVDRVVEVTISVAPANRLIVETEFDLD